MLQNEQAIKDSIATLYLRSWALPLVRTVVNIPFLFVSCFRHGYQHSFYPVSSFISLIPQTVSAIKTLFIALALHPEVQDKARHELIEVIGEDRLPQFSDRRALPYIQAVVQELLRWKPPVPLSERTSHLP